MIFSFFFQYLMSLRSTLGNFCYKRCSVGYSDNRRLSQACLCPSLSESATSWAVKASGEQARGDPSSCEAAPAREAARPCCHKPSISCPESPAAGFRHRSFARKSYSWVLRGKLHVSELRKAACAAKSFLLSKIQHHCSTQQHQPPQ